MLDRDRGEPDEDTLDVEELHDLDLPASAGEDVVGGIEGEATHADHSKTCIIGR